VPSRLAANATDITNGRPHFNEIITAEGINTLSRSSIWLRGDWKTNEGGK